MDISLPLNFPAVAKRCSIPLHGCLFLSPQLACGNTVSPSEGFRRSSAGRILPPRSQCLPSAHDPAPVVG